MNTTDDYTIDVAHEALLAAASNVTRVADVESAGLRRTNKSLNQLLLAEGRRRQRMVVAVLAIHADDHGYCTGCTNESLVSWPCATALAVGAGEKEDDDVNIDDL